MHTHRWSKVLCGAVFAAFFSGALLGVAGAEPGAPSPAPRQGSDVAPLPPLAPLPELAPIGPQGSASATSTSEPVPPAPRCWPGGVPASDGSCAACPKPHVITVNAARLPALPRASSFPVVRDARALRVAQESKALLVTEISQLESLVRATPRDAPDRALILRRTAEDYVELAAVAEREVEDARQRQALVARVASDAAARKLNEVVQARQKLVSNARQAAIRNYQAVVSAGGDSARLRLDEVLYALGYEEERAGDEAAALAAYRQLLQRFPESAYVGAAYLAMGERFFEDAERHPDRWAVARAAYEKAAAAPVPANRVAPYALYKLGHAALGAGDTAGAIAAFARASQVSTKLAQVAGAAELGEAARRDLLAVYARSGAGKDAWAVFQSATEDPALAVTMLEKLGEMYVDGGRFAEAAAVYEGLFAKADARATSAGAGTRSARRRRRLPRAEEGRCARTASRRRCRARGRAYGIRPIGWGSGNRARR